MKKILAFLTLTLTTAAFAVPRGMYLASPDYITVKGEEVSLHFTLNCSNKAPDDWAGQLVSVADDEGDFVVGLGVVLAKSSCTRGPKKKYVFSFPLEETDQTLADLNGGIVFKPISVKK